MVTVESRPVSARVTRRKLLRASISLGALGLAGGIVALVRTRGYDLPDSVRAKLLALEPAHYLVVQHLARRVCTPDEAGVVTRDEMDVAGFVDAYVAGMPRRMRSDHFGFLVYVEQLAPAAVGKTSRFTHLTVHEQDEVLASLESSRHDLLRGLNSRSLRPARRSSSGRLRDAA